MHDVLRPWEKQTGKSHFWKEALEIIWWLLEEVGVQEEKFSAILEVIAHHDQYDWSTWNEKSIELQIVQDADNLEAMGAIGIARCLMYGWAHNCPLWIPGENLDFSHDYIEDGTNTTTVAHFYEKLLRLKDNMNTQYWKKLAQERHEFMEEFLQRLFDEWSGKL